MLSRTEHIDDFHLKVSRAEKELYEEFLETEEPEIVQEMKQYFAQAKQHSEGGIRFDNAGLWSKIEKSSGCLVCRCLCRQKPRRKPGSQIKGSNSAASQTAAGQDHQGIVGYEVIVTMQDICSILSA